MLHRARQLLARQRMTLNNAPRGHLAELGIMSTKGGSARRGCSRSSRMAGRSLLWQHSRRAGAAVWLYRYEIAAFEKSVMPCAAQ
jgi:transposase